MVEAEEHLEDVSLNNGPTLVFPLLLLWVIGFPVSNVTSVPRRQGRVENTQKKKKKEKGVVETARLGQSTSEPTEDVWKGWVEGSKNQKCKVERGGA